MVTHKKTFPSVLGWSGRSRTRAACTNTGPVWTCCRETPISLLPFPAVTSTRRRGDSSGSSPAGEEPGVGASACFPCSCSATGDAFRDDAFHNHQLQGHLAAQRPPLKKLCDLLGEQTLLHLLLSHCLPDPVCPLSTETWIVFALPSWGFASCPGNITIPEKARFSVPSCSFVLA